MVWDANQPYVAESKKIAWEVAPYLRGRGVDIGAGTFKILPHAISVDNGHHSVFGHQIAADVPVKDAEDLSIFATRSMDFVYSSHLLEHMSDPQKALNEWWRLVKIGGVLALYLPHEDLYPKVGEPGANPDHKHNLNEQKVIDWLKGMGGFDIEVCQKRDANEEYSFLMVVRKRDDERQIYSYTYPKPAKTACVVRYGAFGDLMMASSVWAGLKKQGYHVTVFATPPASEVILHDPNIDNLVLFDKDQVPNADLGEFWKWQSRNFDKFVNLSETVEGAFLALPGRAPYTWSPLARHNVFDYNYVQFGHEQAGVPHEVAVKFYRTTEEKTWAFKQRAKMGSGPVVMWSLAGSSVHKTWAGLDNIIAAILVEFPTAHIVLVGGPECVILEAGWESETRVHLTSGKWSMRQSLSFIPECDLVIGPETGVLNAASMEDCYKLVFLSHSTDKNLTRDWKYTVALSSENTVCPGRGNNEAPACHQLHYGWENCKMVEGSGVAQCQADISIDDVWGHVGGMLGQALKDKAA